MVSKFVSPTEYFIVLFFRWIYIIAMPTVLRTGPYRIYFHSHEPNEPPHVHIDREDLSAKFWLQPVHLARNVGFRSAELLKLEEIVIHNKEKLLEAWHGYFGAER